LLPSSQPLNLFNAKSIKDNVTPFFADLPSNRIFGSDDPSTTLATT